MDIEKTIQFLTSTAAQHDARLAKAEEIIVKIDERIVIMEDNNILIQQALLRLAEQQEKTKKVVDETRIDMRRLEEQTDRRIADLVSAIAKYIESRPN